VDTNEIDQETGKAFRTLFHEHLDSAKQCQDKFYQNLAKYRSNDEVVVTFDFKSSINIPCVQRPLATSNYSQKMKIEVLGIVVHNRSIKTQFYLFEEFDKVTKKEMIAHAICDFVQSSKFNFSKIMFFADNTVSQNKNQYIITLFEYIRQSINLESIRFNFMEVGHTYSDVDMNFGKLAAVLKQIDILYTPEDIQKAVQRSGFAECHIISNQNNFDKLFLHSRPVPGITMYQTFIFEDGVLYGSKKMLGRRRKNEQRERLLKFNAFETNLDELMSEHNKIVKKAPSKTYIQEFGKTMALFHSRPDCAVEYYSQIFIDLTQDEDMVRENFQEVLHKTKSIKKIPEKKEKK